MPLQLPEHDLDAVGCYDDLRVSELVIHNHVEFGVLNRLGIRQVREILLIDIAHAQYTLATHKTKKDV